MLLLDMILISVISALCIILIEGELSPHWSDWIELSGSLIIPIVGFMMSYNLYSRLWKYSSIGELVSIFKAVTFGTIAGAVIYFFFTSSEHQAMVIFMCYQSMLLFLGGSRFVYRLFSDNYHRKGTNETRVLVIGAGDCGIMVAKEIKQNKYLNNSYLVGFIDDDPQKKLNRVVGIRVLGDRNDIHQVVKKHAVNHIIIAMPSASRKDISEIANICKETNCELKITPKLDDILQGKITASAVRDVDVEDLLGRAPVQIDLEGIANYVENKIVLITGAGGSIGSELCRQIAPFKPKLLLLLGHGENSIYLIESELQKRFPELKREPLIADVQNMESVMRIFREYRPQVIFHAAAHKHVPLMEKNSYQAVLNNIIGTKNVAEAAYLNGAERFVLISTDKAVNPTSVMGATKRIAEILVQCFSRRSAGTKFAAVRFGNVLGSRGSVIPRFKEQISEGGPVTVTHPEMIRYFMTIPEASQLVIQAGAYATGGEVFILDMDKPVKIFDLAKDLIRLSGFEPFKDIDIVFTGMRPGEKMFEELLTDEEGMSATKNNRIFIGKPMSAEAQEINEEIGQLERIIRVDLTEIKAFIRELLEEKPQLSHTS
ncbi:polysaccharide biosynthesis protein [Paenibacillus sp. FSL R5-0527]|uniref:polysaccharide biosynthesis protein n=1 Tax=Paenibacillus sp. FSL R5-0527 TaxID=2975321 RepID=UPI0030FA05D9